MKNKRTKIILIAVAVLILAPTIVCFADYQIKCHNIRSELDAVDLLTGTETIETKICVSDVYGWHVSGERLVCSDMNVDQLRAALNAEDSDIEVFCVYRNSVGNYEIEWDDWGIDLNCIKGNEKDGMNYYLIQVSKY